MKYQKSLEEYIVEEQQVLTDLTKQYIAGECFPNEDDLYKTMNFSIIVDFYLLKQAKIN